MELEINGKIETLDVKGKLLIVKCDSFDKHMMKQLREQLYGLGCLGVISLPEDSDIESLGVKQLENIVKEIKSMRQEGVKDE